MKKTVNVEWEIEDIYDGLEVFHSRAPQMIYKIVIGLDYSDNNSANYIEEKWCMIWNYGDKAGSSIYGSKQNLLKNLNFVGYLPIEMRETVCEDWNA
jgi:hypothetical protein